MTWQWVFTFSLTNWCVQFITCTKIIRGNSSLISYKYAICLLSSHLFDDDFVDWIFFYQADTSVPWLSEALVLFTVGLQFCQQLKDKVSVFTQYKDMHMVAVWYYCFLHIILPCSIFQLTCHSIYSRLIYYVLKTHSVNLRMIVAILHSLKFSNKLFVFRLWKYSFLCFAVQILYALTHEW